MAVTRVLPLAADAYERHPVHRSERIWAETNCYVDLWIEVLHALGLEPLAASAFALTTDFEGDQWTFFKFPPEDLQRMYGIRVFEMNPWRGVLDHVLEHLADGRLVTVEVDGWYLPDTGADSYRVGHGKTTIVPNEVDPEARRLGYFHNASYYELEGDDFDGVFRLVGSPPEALAPYIETIRLDGLERLPASELAERSRELLHHHVHELPADNPVPRFRRRLGDDLGWLRSAGTEGFHRWAFGAIRQLGASAEVAAAALRWLDDAEGSVARAAIADRLVELSSDAKTLQFQAARLSRGRDVEVGPLLDRMADTWEAIRRDLEAHVG